MKNLKTNRQNNNRLLKTISTALMLTTGLAVSLPALADQTSQVSVSNYPLYLLSKAVTEGTPEAKPLLEPGDVGHHGSLSPSDKKTIQQSKYVVWFGEPLERNLADTLTKAPNAISLYDMKAFHRKPLREINTQPIDGTLDPHIWLDPDNAKAIVRALAVIHSHADPKHKDLFMENAKKFAKKMDEAVAEINKNNQNKNQKYWAYHDAYQYIEPALHIQLAGTLTPDHHLPPKASQFKWLNEHRPNNNPTKHMCMVTQGEATQGMINKLQPLSTTVQQEDMSQNQDFIEGWKQMAQQILACMQEK